MSQERLMKVLLEPHVSEKSTNVAEQANQVVFKVVPDATKDEIKQAVEKLFEVSVEGVQVVNVKGKNKRNRFGNGKRKDWKKAYVSLKAGDDINFIGTE
ncbi:MAG: 50S ribosomal protein L23 [Gammaproteobacteria bacterium]|nr:50S ribosomal protein L23 [Gammaproteobacteria bacterium]